MPDKATLHPVILPVPESKKQVRGREKVRFLSAHARRALQYSANLSRVSLKDPSKNADGVPLPSQGIFWSVTHKPLYVGGVVAKAPIGMDIEYIKSVASGMHKKVAQPEEWDLGQKMDTQELFYRYWTSKEAVIKAQGTGIKDLLKCQVVEIPDKYTLTLNFCHRQWTIEHFYFDGHLASIVRNNKKIHWTLKTDIPDDF